MYTLEKFLSLDNISWYKTISGKSKLASSIIEFISVIELPVDNFVRENELVLSTALGCENDHDFLRLVKDIYESGAVALLIAKKKNDFSIPNNVQQFLNKTNFPLIFIPWEARFSDLVEQVLIELRSESISTISFYENIQSKILKSYLANEDLSSAAKILSNSFKSDIQVFDIDINIKGSSKINSIDYDSLILIQNNNRHYGYLAINQFKESPKFNLSLLQRYILPCLVLWFDREWTIHISETNAKDQFIQKLINEDACDDLIAQASLLGFNLTLPYSCLVLGIYNTSANLIFGDKLVLESWLSDKWLIIQEQISSSAKQLSLSIMFSYRDDNIIIYLENKKENLDTNPYNFIDVLEAKINSLFSNITYSWGINEITLEKSNFKKAYDDYRIAENLCACSQHQTRRYTFEDTIVFKIISTLSYDNDISNKLSQIIKPIMNYDYNYNGNLLITLKDYLQTRNASQTARNLHLHRQSLLYRLNQIEELLNLSLKDQNNLYLLETCIRLQLDFKTK